MKLKVVLEPVDEGGYTIYVPSLPDCISEGDTLKEAIEFYLEPTAMGNLARYITGATTPRVCY